MYDVPNKETMKYEILHHLSVPQHGNESESCRAEVIQCALNKLKTACQCRLRQRFHDVVSIVHEQHVLQPLTLAAVSVNTLRVVVHPRVFTANRLCLVFSKKFNIMSALFVHQTPTLPQKIDSREGLF